jgi:hypothetical protein
MDRQTLSEVSGFHSSENYENIGLLHGNAVRTCRQIPAPKMETECLSGMLASTYTYGVKTQMNNID